MNLYKIHCYFFEEAGMKKVSFFILSVILFLIAGCGDESRSLNTAMGSAGGKCYGNKTCDS